MEITSVIKEQEVQEIVCTGITKIDELISTKLPVVAILYLPYDIKNARELAKTHLNLRVEVGLSIPQADAINFYVEESRSVELDNLYDIFPLTNDILFNFINNHKKQFIFLDNLEGLDHLEFDKVMELRPTYLHKKVLAFNWANIGHLDLQDIGYKVYREKREDYTYTLFEPQEEDE